VLIEYLKIIKRRNNYRYVKAQFELWRRIRFLKEAVELKQRIYDRLCFI